MQLEFDSLKCAKMLIDRGLGTSESEAIVETLTETDFRNCYSKAEIDNMLPQTVKDVFQSVDKQLEERRWEFDKRLADMERRYEADRTAERSEFRATRRWLVGTIITCTFALAGYLSAILHLMH